MAHRLKTLAKQTNKTHIIFNVVEHDTTYSQWEMFDWKTHTYYDAYSYELTVDEFLTMLKLEPKLGTTTHYMCYETDNALHIYMWDSEFEELIENWHKMPRYTDKIGVPVEDMYR